MKIVKLQLKLVEQLTPEIFSQMSRKLEGVKSDLNSHILEVINSAIEGKVIPRIRSVLGDQNAARNVNLDLRSDEPPPSTSSSSRPQWDLGSNGRHQENASETVQNTEKDFPRLVAMSNNHPNHHGENHEDPNQSDGDDDYDSNYDTKACHGEIASENSADQEKRYCFNTSRGIEECKYSFRNHLFKTFDLISEKQKKTYSSCSVCSSTILDCNKNAHH